MQKIELTERGLYTLPDKSEVVVSIAGDGRDYLLYKLKTWKHHGTAEYRAHAGGRIYCESQPTDWRIEDLRDTGKVAE